MPSAPETISSQAKVREAPVAPADGIYRSRPAF
jgi:hypothetical protein